MGIIDNIDKWIYKKKNNPREDRSEAWIYVDGTENGILGAKSGQITFENLSLKVGKYDIFLFENNTSEVILSAASFEIVESPIISVDNNLTGISNRRSSGILICSPSFWYSPPSSPVAILTTSGITVRPKNHVTSELINKTTMLNVTHLRTWRVVIFVGISAVMLVKGILVFINGILPQPQS